MHKKIAYSCGVNAVTVKEYLNILEQTLIGYMIPAFTQSRKRRAVIRRTASGYEADAIKRAKYEGLMRNVQAVKSR